ncbi:unnamed protein product [Peronospora destructor]|uniref:Uncharacterized protein n=1 Tax=Peronospora destructor TaxID=86335 RepID=A0AAV0UNN2_9STRA|nr:unnamed protein product [Peronospora destructor]
MFLCARDASSRHLEASNDVNDNVHSRDISSIVLKRPDPLSCGVLTLSHSSVRRPEVSVDFAAYLQLLDTSTRLVAQVLGVHTLSPSLRFSAGESVAVDAAEWWKEVQRQSIALVQGPESAE